MGDHLTPGRAAPSSRASHAREGKPMLNYNHLYYFHVAASEGSVAAAAARMGVTQPTVSEQIRALERALDVTLFERTATGLRLTETGRLAHEHTTVMFNAAERLIEALGRGGQMVPRTLRVGISAAVARSSAADFLMPLFSVDDAVPSIRTADAVELFRALRSADLDLVLTESPPPDNAMRGLECAELSPSVLVAVAPDAVTPADRWENVSIVQYRMGSSWRWAVEAYLDEHDLSPRVAGEADDALLMVEAAARGGLIAFVPRSVARDAVAAGRLRVVASIEPARVVVHAIYQDGEASEMARRAVEILIEHARSS
jgi:LysR family transcriptional regulator, transcriptional activator of nhaA